MLTPAVEAQRAAIVLEQNAPPTWQKSFTPSTIGPGSVSTLRFDINNPEPVPAPNLAFTDNLPAGMTIASPSQAFSTCGGTLDAPDGGSTITLSGGGIGASSSCYITVDVTSSTPGTHTNVSGDLTSDEGNSGSVSADLTVDTGRPGFTKAFSPDTVLFGGRTTLTFTIDNTANGSTAFSLSFVDNLPSGMVIASPSNASSTCNGGTLSAPVGGSVISFGPDFSVPGSPSVAGGASCTVTVDVLGNSVGSLGNTSGELTATVGGPTVSSGKAAAVLTVTVDRLSLTKSFTDDPVSPGGTVTLQFTLRNLVRSDSASSITFTDDLDAVLSGLVAVGTPISDPCGPGSTLSGTSVLTLTGGNLDPGGTCTFSVTVQVPASASSGTYTNTTSQVTGDLAGRPVTGSSASDILVVATRPVLTKEFVDDPVGAGDSVTLEFTITNTSLTESATDIEFTDEFDSILQTASGIPGSAFCGPSSTATFIPSTSFDPARLFVSGASLAAGDSCTFSITLDVVVGAATGTYPNTTSEVTATIGGETVTGNPASDGLQVVGAPRLFKEFTDDPANPGDTVTLELTIVHDENAPGDATDITFTDDLDATLSGLVATGLPLTDVCGVGSEISGTMTLTFTGGTLAPGESCTFGVTLQVPSTAPAGPHTNTTSTGVATVDGVTTMAEPATDDLDVAGLILSKEFIDDPALPGGTVTLRFTIDNISPVSDATGISFQDDLDDALSGLTATGLPMSDVCGTGSSLTGLSGDSLLVFAGGSLVSGDSCTFDVVLDVPAGADDGVYFNSTGALVATIDGGTVVFDNATDQLTISSDFLALTKEFTDDPVEPGGTVTLELTVTNLSDSESVADIAFTDDLDAALSGLASTSGTQTDVCGAGSQLSGTDVLTLTGGSLAPGASCTFSATLSVPAGVELGGTAVNTTSEVTGTVGGLPVSGPPASDTLRIDFVIFTKSFSGNAFAGGTVTLTFNIQNLDANTSISGLRFTDDLNGVIPGLVTTGLPVSDVCGSGSTLLGTSILELQNGSLLPGGSCTFSVVLSVPASAVEGSYENVTSDLEGNGDRVAAPATAILTIVPADSDGDGVLDDVDVCPGTVIPEGVPTVRLGVNHFALVDGDGLFDTTPPPGGGKGPQASFTIEDTAGCS
ncbi:MAG: hypothetical protein PVG07_06930, partial [Acidobacteriota bacterium]